MRSAILAAAALRLGSQAFAQISSTCPETNVCFSLNVPNTTATSNSGDIYFQLSAPKTYSWVALGQGESMTGANMFVMYTSANGNNVTVSPRLGTGHVQPKNDNSTQIYLLDGTGVNSTTMLANVRCSNCQSWSGGSMDFSQSSASWIYASKTGSALDSDDVTESIGIHDGHGSLTFDLAKAKGGDSVDPFTTADATTTSSSSGSSAASSSSPSSDGGGGGASDKIVLAHAALACIAWVAIFPTGGILVRLANFTGLVWVHAAMQILGYAVYIAAVGMGIYIAMDMGELGNKHPIIGLILLAVYFFQPLTGWLHHLLFKKTGGRGIFSYTHLFIGRAAIILGIINGGLGLQLARADNSDYIAYGVCAGFMGVVYLACIVYGEMVRTKTRGRLGSENSFGGQRKSRDQVVQHENRLAEYK